MLGLFFWTKFSGNVTLTKFDNINVNGFFFYTLKLIKYIDINNMSHSLIRGNTVQTDLQHLYE